MFGDWAGGRASGRHPSYGRCRPHAAGYAVRGPRCPRHADPRRGARPKYGRALAASTGGRSARRARVPGGAGPRPLAVYEAGPTGFALARAAAERGLDVRVCAPGLILRGPTDRIKTDARDAERLARLLAAGELSFVHIPTVDQEQLRDLIRAREDLRGDLNRARQRLSHFLRRRALRCGGLGKNWTRAHRD